MAVVMSVVQEEHTAAKPREQAFDLAAIEGRARSSRRAFQSVYDARHVTLGLEPSQEPGAAVRQRLVVDVDGILSRENDT